MDITWHGQSCFEIKAKDTSIVTDPYSNDTGLVMQKLKADIVTVSHEHYDHNAIAAVQGKADGVAPFIAATAGGYEIKGVLMEGVASFHDDKGGAERGTNTMFEMRLEGMSLCHLGDLGHILSDEQIEALNGVDILMVPVGGTYTLDAKMAAKVVNQIEPHIIIPMHYAIDGLKIDLAGVDAFIKELGMEPTLLDILKIAKKDLPVDDARLVVLKHN